jgi:hypothetical protein
VKPAGVCAAETSADSQECLKVAEAVVVVVASVAVVAAASEEAVSAAAEEEADEKRNFGFCEALTVSGL